MTALSVTFAVLAVLMLVAAATEDPARPARPAGPAKNSITTTRCAFVVLYAITAYMLHAAG